MTHDWGSMALGFGDHDPGVGSEGKGFRAEVVRFKCTCFGFQYQELGFTIWGHDSGDSGLRESGHNEGLRKA